MPETTDPDSQATAAAAGAAGASGCVIFLIDESAAMDARVAGGTKSKAASVATAVNSLLSQLAAGRAVDVSIVGYRVPGDGVQDIGPRWGGALAGRQFVPSGELAAAPLCVETRVRRVPGAGGIGVAREETVPFPVWYTPSLGGPASIAEALEHCRGMLSGWISAAGPHPKPPMIVSFVGEMSTEQTPQAAGKAVGESETSDIPPLVVHAHLSSSDRIPAILYPSSDTHLPPGPIRALFQASSVLPQELCGWLRQLRVTVNAGARGLIYNAKMVDLIRLLSVVKSYLQYRPPAAQEAATEAEEAPTSSAGEAVAGAAAERLLVVLLLDRSVEDPSGDEENNVWPRLEEHANELLRQISKRGRGRIDSAVVSYGTAVGGGPEVETTFCGPLAGRTVVCDTDLAGGALRVEEVTEQVSNGIGGLVSVTRKRPVFVDLKPTVAAAPSPGFAAVKGVLAEWRKEHAECRAEPVVLHMTRGRFKPDEIDEAVDQLRDIGPLRLYHLVVSELPHAPLAYPADPTGIQEAGLVKLWEVTSPLLGAQTLAARNTAVLPQSRGMVINGKFDLLLDAFEEALVAG